MQRAAGISDRKHFGKAYLHPALKDGLLAMTIPSKPRSINQKYVTTEKGRRILVLKK
jgi:ATP-dependent DNA helicase RecG